MNKNKESGYKETMFYIVEDDNNGGLFIWRGTPILRPYTDLPYYDLYRIRIIMNGTIHYFRNDSDTHRDIPLKHMLAGWLRAGRDKKMTGLLSE